MIETKLSVKEIERIIVAYLGGVRTNIIVPNLSWGFLNHEADLIAVDKNGVKIFEGDIISIGDPNIKYITMWRSDGFCAKQIGASSYIGLTYWASHIEVLGNVIDNPELIK